jgi:hypothetical protein
MMQTSTLTSNSQPNLPAAILRWSGRIFFGLNIAFLIFDTVIKLLNVEQAVTATVGLGYAESDVFVLGVIQLICLILYLIPQTAPLGAVLMTGYLGGAVATHLQAGSEPFSLIFPVIMGAILWAALYLREARLRALLPIRR